LALPGTQLLFLWHRPPACPPSGRRLSLAYPTGRKVQGGAGSAEWSRSLMVGSAGSLCSAPAAVREPPPNQFRVLPSAAVKSAGRPARWISQNPP
jgi:hypothetical protein